MKKTNLITEFMKKNSMVDKTWNSFLAEYELNELTVRDLAGKYNLNYNSLRYLFYSLGFVNNSKAKRMESVLELQKDLARESGAEYNIVEELEKELDLVINKNRALVRTVNITRDENNHLRKIARREDRGINVVGTLLDMFQEKIDKMTFTETKYEFPNEYLAEQELQKGLVGVFSDIHSGDQVIDSITPFNNYNYEIMENRMLKVTDEIILFEKQSKDLTMFHLLDDLKGIIHGGLYSSLDGLSTSMLKIVEVYSKVYTKLSPFYDNIDIYVTNSNHDRKTEKPSSENKWDNFGIMLAKFLEMILKAKGINNVNFYYTLHEYHLVSINEANIFVFHGDSLRNFKPYSPTEISKAQDICMGIFNKTFKHTINGHFHIANACANQYGGMSISNGTLVGNTPYGIANGFRGIIPSQTIFFVNKEGNIEDIKILNLSNIQG